jgi:predicted TIM-barrel fold metal-dependent hydrolase
MAGIPVIDTHHHYLPAEFVDRLESFVPDYVSVSRQGGRVILERRADRFGYTVIDREHWCDAERQIAVMDACGVAHALLSIACFTDWLTPAAATLYNDGVAEVVARYPARFSAVAAVCPDDEASGREELARCANADGFVAVNLTTSAGGRYPDDPAIRWLFDAARQARLPVFLHPSFNPPGEFAVGGMSGWDLERTLGKVTDLTLAITRLLYSGALDSRELSVTVAHLGGALPFVKRRLFFGPPGFGAAPEADYASLLRQVWVDTAPGIYQGPEEIRFSCERLGSDRVLFGSDYPVTADPVDMLEQSLGHVQQIESAESRQRILLDNALACFPRLDRRLILREASTPLTTRAEIGASGHALDLASAEQESLPDPGHHPLRIGDGQAVARRDDRARVPAKEVVEIGDDRAHVGVAGPEERRLGKHRGERLDVEGGGFLRYLPAVTFTVLVHISEAVAGEEGGALHEVSPGRRLQVAQHALDDAQRRIAEGDLRARVHR